MEPPFIREAVSNPTILIYDKSRTTTAVPASASVDWTGFYDWLRHRGLRERYCLDLLSYAKRYCHFLFEKRLAPLEMVAGTRMALSALANLSRFLGQYSSFRQLREESEVRWATTSAESLFLAFYDGSQSVTTTEAWMDSLKGLLGWEDWFRLVYMAESGQRTGEAISTRARRSLTSSRKKSIQKSS